MRVLLSTLVVAAGLSAFGGAAQAVPVAPGSPVGSSLVEQVQMSTMERRMERRRMERRMMRRDRMERRAMRHHRMERRHMRRMRAM